MCQQQQPQQLRLMGPLLFTLLWQQPHSRSWPAVAAASGSAAELGSVLSASAAVLWKPLMWGPIRQTLTADVIGAIYYVWLVIALRLPTERLQYVWTDGVPLVLWEVFGRMLAVALFCGPSVLLVVFRQQLVATGR